jgi:hypothetical protein
MHHDASRDAPPTTFIKPHTKEKHGSNQGFVLQEYHEGM